MFDELVRSTNSDVDHRGWAAIDCPECGAESTIKNPNCGFGPYKNGYIWKCFHCDTTGSLKDLAERLELDCKPVKMPQKPRRATKKYYRWLHNPTPFLSAYIAAQERFEQWQQYKPLTKETIEKSILGLGVLPASSCRHKRLIVPVFDGTMLVGLRGRRIDCNCKNWLQAGGTKKDRLPLYGSEDLYSGCVAVIVENCPDAKFITQETDFVGVATYSTVYWRDEWMQELKKHNPRMVVVAYDNDLPGNGGGVQRKQFMEIWKREHPKSKKIPKSFGVKLTNTLLENNLPSILFDWKDSEYKEDFGSMLTKERICNAINF